MLVRALKKASISMVLGITLVMTIGCFLTFKGKHSAADAIVAQAIEELPENIKLIRCASECLVYTEKGTRVMKYPNHFKSTSLMQKSDLTIFHANKLHQWANGHPLFISVSDKVAVGELANDLPELKRLFQYIIHNVDKDSRPFNEAISAIEWAVN